VRIWITQMSIMSTYKFPLPPVFIEPRNILTTAAGTRYHFKRVVRQFPSTVVPCDIQPRSSTLIIFHNREFTPASTKDDRIWFSWFLPIRVLSVLKFMFCYRSLHCKILRAIVRSIFFATFGEFIAFMVNQLRGKKISSENLFSYQPMFINITTLHRVWMIGHFYNHITMRGNASSPMPVGIIA